VLLAVDETWGMSHLDPLKMAQAFSGPSEIIKERNMAASDSSGEDENKPEVFERLREWRDSSTPLRLDLFSSPGARVMQIDASVVGVNESAIEFSWSLETPPFMRSSGTLEVFLAGASLFIVTAPPRVTIRLGANSCVLREFEK